MVEYGGGIHNGPAGQVAGGGGGSPDMAQPDLFTNIGNAINDTANAIFSLPPEILVLGIVLFFVGLIVLKRAF